jgi:hypothetical protein
MSVGKKRPPRFRVGDGVSLLFGTQKVDGEVLEDRGNLGVFGRRLYRVRINRGREDERTFEVQEEDLENLGEPPDQPDAPGLRQELAVAYTRIRDTNRWTATTERGQLYRGVRAKGVIGYATAKWSGETGDDENHAVVTVFVECDRTMCDSRGRVRPSAWPAMTATARELADRRFKTRHPDAVIEHVDEG